MASSHLYKMACLARKSRGAACHCAVIVGYRHGAGGNLVPQDVWETYESYRKPYDSAFRNPFMVRARVGGDHGYWGGKDVATQLIEVQEYLKWEQMQPWYEQQVVSLAYPGTRELNYVFGVDQSQTHLLSKPDGIIMSRFHMGSKQKSTTNGKAADNFCIPHDIILQSGDVNVCPDVASAIEPTCTTSSAAEILLEYKPGDLYTFKLANDRDKGLEQIAKELGWYKEGMRKAPKS